MTEIHTKSDKAYQKFVEDVAGACVALIEHEISLMSKKLDALDSFVSKLESERNAARREENERVGMQGKDRM